MDDKQNVTSQTGQTATGTAQTSASTSSTTEQAQTPASTASTGQQVQQGQGREVQQGQGQEVQQGQSQKHERRDGRSMVPRVDVLEDEAGITLLADLPGVPKDGLEIKVEGDTLLIDGNVATPTPQGLRSVYAEVRIPRYRRAFTLSRELDPGRIEANMKDGVLKLRIPKQEHARPRRITVGAG
jgi:HSP20 family molecular chaperone IbpA